ncbi:DUF3800 domain-containing protein [Laceyella sacchari]|uniref:DUF3800 domain-containing protein n=1 Tax=Laceyella sacchari TaxID=37482 RepID=A0ABY5U8N3_LACSH|nr:DUF3800 domain-containing protein [Laceyella sacchari]TCW40774.1 uncharacterized protein DUF3800 [Laceyella sacchari]UWE04398.1 DUF3800 domain-containing protein [Laceyella sacchari]
MSLIVIWGDESSQNAHKYMVLGTIWQRADTYEALEAEVAGLRRQLGFEREFHWNEMKKTHRDAYIAFIDLFIKHMRQGNLKFRALIVDMTDKKNVKTGDNKEAHFYKMFFWLIYKWLAPEHHYDIFLDRKSNSVPGRLQDLEYYLNRKMAADYIKLIQQTSGAKEKQTIAYPLIVVRRVESRDGTQTPLQMADVLAGAIAYVRNGHYEKAVANRSRNPKRAVVNHLEAQLGFSLKDCHARNEHKGFNLFCFKR